MNLFNRTPQEAEAYQLIYSLIVIILIPVAIALNTVFLLRGIRRDMDFELNNKALLVGSAIAVQSRDKMANLDSMKQVLDELVQRLPEIKAIELYKINEDELKPIVTTSQRTKAVADPVLNQLAWSTNESYSKQITAAVGKDASAERIWLVVSPMQDSANKKLGLVNLYISAAQIDAITSRTVKDSLIVLVATMVVVLLLLANHFRFFEISLLFRKLSEVDRMKDDFISMASHELKAPLTAIASYAFLLNKNEAIAASDTARRHVQIIAQGTERLRTLVEDILDVSRIEQKRLKLTLSEQDLTSIVTAVIDEFMPQAQAKSLQLIYKNPQAKVLVRCDKDKTHQIFANLVSNAIKYTPQGSVSVYFEIQGKYVKTYVKDTGIGISQENREKLFQKFSRIYHEETKDVPGTGLGLWITKELVEKMGGKISVESIEHQGSQFVVTLPLLASQPLSAVDSLAASGSARPAQAPTSPGTTQVV